MSASNIFRGGVVCSFLVSSLTFGSPQVDLHRAEELLHCSVMAHRIKWPGYLTMTFAHFAYLPCDDLDVIERNECANPIRSIYHRIKDEQKYAEPDMDYCISLIEDDVDTAKLKAKLDEAQKQYYERMAEHSTTE